MSRMKKPFPDFTPIQSTYLHQPIPATTRKIPQTRRHQQRNNATFRAPFHPIPTLSSPLPPPGAFPATARSAAISPQRGEKPDFPSRPRAHPGPRTHTMYFLARVHTALSRVTQISRALRKIAALRSTSSRR